MHEWLSEWIGQPKGRRLFWVDNMLTKFFIDKIVQFRLIKKYFENILWIVKNLNLGIKGFISFPLKAKAE